MLFNKAKKNLQKKNCYKVGQIIKSHAHKGQLRINFFIAPEKITQEPIFVEIDGYLVPFFIDNDLSNLRTIPPIIKFHGINCFEDAKNICDSNIYLPKKNISPVDDYITDFYNFVVGFQLIEEHNHTQNFISSFIKNNKNPMWVIQNTSDNDTLIPINAVEILKINYSEQKIYVNIPTSLWNID